MSLLWRKQLRIALAPDMVSAVLLAPGRQGKVERKAVWPCRPVPLDTHPWEAALRTFSQNVAGLKAADADVSFVLSNHFVRYVLLPWSDQLTGAGEREAMAGIHFERHFGAAVGGWTVCLSDSGYGKASLASAVDAPLPVAIVHVCKAAKLSVGSVQPYLMSAFNHYRRGLTADSFCVAVAEDRRVGLLMAQAGEWHAVRNLPLRGPLTDQLLPIVNREILLAGLSAPARIYLHAPCEPGLALPSSGAPPVAMLDLAARTGFSPQADADIGMAMTGAF